MAEYIDIDTPLEVYVVRGGYCEKKITSLRELWDGHTEKDVTRLLSLDVRPVVRGKWVETKTGFHCSACKTKAKGTKDGALLSNFCPNCGADMRETNDEKA